jgi:beta-N-acetylhexosaminidase
VQIASIPIHRKVGMLLMAPLYADCMDELIGKFGCGSLLSWGGEFGDSSPDNIPEFCALMNRVQELSQQHRGLPTWIHGWPHQAIAGRRQGWLGRAAANDTDAERVERAAQLIGRRWRALGVHNIPEPTLNVPMHETGILGDTITSADPEKVRCYGTAFNRGILAGNCGSMAQHFPAHGATPLDSHDNDPVVDATIDELWPDHLLPYQQCFDDGCTTICTAHLTLTALDPDNIATTSKAVLTDFLKGKMGFKGIAIADAVEMKGFQKDGSIPEMAVEAVKAGCDSICMVAIDNVEPVYNSLLEAAESGDIPPERLEDAVERNLRFMRWLGLEEKAQVDADAAAETLRDLDTDPDSELLR